MRPSFSFSLFSGIGLATMLLLGPVAAMADQPVQSGNVPAFPESDRRAAAREENRQRTNTHRTQNRPDYRRNPPPISDLTQQERREHEMRRNRRNSNRDQAHERHDRRQYRNGYRDGRRTYWDRWSHDNNYRTRTYRPRRNQSQFSIHIGTGRGYGYERGYGRDYGYGLGYGRHIHQDGFFSLFGGQHYQPGYDLYPWWYGDRDWGYRTRGGYRTGYGHLGHSNVFCTDRHHRQYDPNWRNAYTDDRRFSTYSQYTNGGYGGYTINSCHLENRRGVFEGRDALVRVTVCWDEQNKRYTETGAVQLVR